MSAALAVASCGEEALSKEEFTTAADAICADAQERAQDLPQPTDPGSAEAYADSVEEITTDYVDELRVLEPPEEDAEETARLFDDIEEAGLKIVEAIRMQGSGENPASAFSEALHLAEEANEAAKDYGFSSCGVSEGLTAH